MKARKMALWIGGPVALISLVVLAIGPTVEIKCYSCHKCRNLKNVTTKSFFSWANQPKEKLVTSSSIAKDHVHEWWRYSTYVKTGWPISSALVSSRSHQYKDGKSSTSSAEPSQELRRLENSIPAIDLEIALKKNDTRFIGVSGFTVEVPGVENPNHPLVSSNSIHVIEGTSDVIVSPEHSRLQSIAREYARQYNELLLKHLSNQQTTEKP